MKKAFISLVCVLVSGFTFSQHIIIAVNPIDSVGCQKLIQVLMSNSNTSVETGVLTLDWGDGSPISQQNYTIPSTFSLNSQIYLDFYHSYAVGGNYTIDVQGISSSNTYFINSNGNQVISAYGANNCSYANIGIDINGGACATFATYHAQIDFTDNQNVTTTIDGDWNIYRGLNPSNAPYTVSLNDAWLLANNFTQLSADLVVSGFNANGEAIEGYQSFLVDWESVNLNADPAFNFGSAWNFVAPLQTGSLNVNLNNLTCMPMTSNATISITIPSLFIPNTTGLLNANISGNILTFEVAPYVGNSWLNIPFTFPGATPAGTAFCFDVTVSYTGDADVSNNAGQVCGIVVNSYDPNDKQVNLPAQLNPDAKEKLMYRIQFQNDGNYHAVNINVTDVIDNNLNLATLRVLESSHPQATKINAATRQVDFSFNNIMLGPSSENLELSQGFVVYEIEENTNLPLGSEIENTANIYFDFNPPIVTNTTYNINEYELGIKEINKMSLQIFPNPANEKITFKGEDVDEVRIFDLAGKLILSSNQVTNNILSVQNLSNGFYTIVVKTTTGSSTTKLSIQH